MKVKLFFHKNSTVFLTGLPSIGIVLADFGVYSDMYCKNTVIVRNIVIIREIFSPLSGGNQNVKSA